MIQKSYVNGVEFLTEIRGSGDPLVLVSGFTADRAIWEPVVNAFEKHFKVLIFDNRGVGQSESPDHPYTVEMMADDTLALWTEVFGRSKKVKVVGHSMGGAIAQTLAFKHPDKVDLCVIANSFPVLGEAFRYVCRYKLDMYRRGIPVDLIDRCAIPWAFSKRFLSNYRVIDQIETTSNLFPQTVVGYKNQLHALLSFNSQEWLNQIRVPCRIIAGEDDLIAPVSDSQRLQELITGARLEIMKGVGHVPQVEDPEGFVRILKRCLLREG